MKGDEPKDVVFAFRVSADLKKRFQDYCKARNLNAAALVRSLIEAEMAREKGRKKP